MSKRLVFILSALLSGTVLSAQEEGGRFYLDIILLEPDRD